MEELFEMYKNLDMKESIEFDKLYYLYQEERFNYINAKLHKEFLKPFFPKEYVDNYLKPKQ